MLPASTWKLDKWEDFFTLENSLVVIALGISTMATLAAIYAIQSIRRVQQMLALMAMSARPVRAKTIQSEESFWQELQALTIIEKYFYGFLALSIGCQVIILIIWLLYKLYEKMPKHEFATLEIIVKSGASQIRITTMKVTCQPMSLIQEADQSVAIVKATGPTQRMTLHLNWGNRVYRHIATDSLIYPKSVIVLTREQGKIASWILKNPYTVYTGLIYHDKKGNLRKAPASLHDLPRSTVCFTQVRRDVLGGNLPQIPEHSTGIASV